MTTYNHAFTIAFQIEGSTTADGSEITPEQFRRAIETRLRRLGDLEIMEAIGAPFDSFEEDSQ